jgi:Ca2+-transporting ATPase
VYLNIRKVITYLLATNVGEVLLLFMILGSALAFGSPLPLALLPIHILWVNLVTDGVCDVTLAMEPRERGLMAQKPRSPGESIISPEMLFFLVFSAVIIAAGTFAAYLYFLGSGSLEHARTATFTTLSFFQLFSAINFRSFRESVFSRGLLSNPYLVGAIAVSILLQLSVIYTPWLNETMKTTPLSLEDWAVVILVSSTVFFAVEAKKMVSGPAAPKGATARLH